MKARSAARSPGWRIAARLVVNFKNVARGVRTRAEGSGLFNLEMHRSINTEDASQRRENNAI
jgi:hypothetical protein